MGMPLSGGDKNKHEDEPKPALMLKSCVDA